MLRLGNRVPTASGYGVLMIQGLHQVLVRRFAQAGNLHAVQASRNASAATSMPSREEPAATVVALFLEVVLEEVAGATVVVEGVEELEELEEGAVVSLMTPRV
jgi:hypothetical protein